ncbi:MAG: hypothetical protein WD294_15710 [Phycisphaeraceae bacterium]
MDGRTITFLIFIAFSMACLALGYAARRRGWLNESVSRPLHLNTLIWLWSPISLVSFWGLPLGGEAGGQLIVLMLAQPVLMIAAAAAMAPLARAIGCTRSQQGVMILAAALSNHGFTLGAYLCYALLEPAADALRYGIAYVTSMQIFMVLIFYPVASRFGIGSGSIGEMMRSSFLTSRAVPLYAAGAGLLLNLSGLPDPQWVIDTGLMEVMFFLAAAGSYAGIGLLLRVGDSLAAWRMHSVVGFIQFIFHPLATIALIGGLVFTGVLVTPLLRDVMIVEALTPTAINVVIAANIFHLDARLGSVLWVTNTFAFCLFVLPLMLWFF